MRAWMKARAGLWAAVLAAPLVLTACGEGAGSGGEAAAPETNRWGQSEPADAVFTVLTSGTPIGAVEVWRGETGYAIGYEFRNNGRGPTYQEDIRLDDAGHPVHWTIEGATTFGNQVDEMFHRDGDGARWRDSTGEAQASPDGPALYVPQNASPYALGLAARALMAAPERSLPALPGGSLRLDPVETLSVADAAGMEREVQVWALSGTSLNPSWVIMDGDQFFASVSPRFAVIAQGFEGEDERLRARASDYEAERYGAIQERVARRYDGPVRIANVRVFDPDALGLTEPVSVLIEGSRIVSIDDAGTRESGETVIDGAGGSLIPGLFEMHAHLGETAAFLNVAAGVTSVRDMGNDNDSLDRLAAEIEAGRVAGPRIFRSAFIEGRSPFNSNSGVLVDSVDDAVAAVHAYADRGGFHQIKIYNSMSPDWIPDVIAAAREREMRVSGHIPAFTNANAMIEAGYDEITHINQLMLGWVLEADEDTRTLLRLTALKRLPELDLDSAAVNATLDAMAARGVSIDPTLVIHESLLLSRNGVINPGAVDYIDHMPVSVQRSARSAWVAIESEADDAAYRGAFDQIIETLRRMRDRGIFLVPGTDTGGSFTYHRELELYQQIGMSPAEILAWAGHGMADYLGAGDELGRIAPGYLADFFLVPGDPSADLKAIKTISMVAADGVIYFPEDIYPEFGIRPFVAAPAVSVAQ
ncbi:MAG: amidohydrolase family protein [Oceanicaulis sp.]